MKAKDLSGQAPGGKRMKLADVLPLSTPLVVQIFPAYACNFKCNYCIFSIKKSQRNFISDKIFMEIDLYKKSIDDMCSFDKKIKVLRFVGIGEPLLHKRIVEMIRYASEREIAEKIEILTNASLLTPEMTNALISAGLTRLVVSIQGTNSEKYKKISKTDIDFKEFLANLKYFNENKNGAESYLKIVDSAIDSDDEESQYFSIFGDLCDSIAIEHTVPIHEGIDYEKVIKQKEIPLTQFGLPVSEVSVCPQPFFTLQINPDGKIVPCYSFEYPEIIGDCNHKSVCEIWNGEKFNQFRRKMLNGVMFAANACRNCQIIKYRLFPEDNISGAAERLKIQYENQ